MKAIMNFWLVFFDDILIYRNSWEYHVQHVDRVLQLLKEKQKWVTKMLGYDFEIIYKKGKQNVVVDALSRKDEDVEAFLRAISIIQPDWVTEARDEWKNDEKSVDSHSKVAVGFQCIIYIYMEK